MTTNRERMDGWAKVPGTKTATVEDVRTLRANTVANMNALAAEIQERVRNMEGELEKRLDRLETAVTSLDRSLSTLRKDAESNLTHDLGTLRKEVSDVVVMMRQSMDWVEGRVTKLEWRHRLAVVVTRLWWRVRLLVHRDK